MCVSPREGYRAGKRGSGWGMEEKNGTPRQSADIELRPLQRQTQKYALTNCAKKIIQLLALNSSELTDYLKGEAERNPCVELVFPQADKADLIETLVAAKEDYRNELLWQLPREGNKTVLRIARGLIGQLDSFGYLPFDPLKRCPEDLSRETRTAVRLVQSLEPAGVGARSLRECYYLQARRATRPQEDACALLSSAALFRLYVNGAQDEVCARLCWERGRLDAVTRVLAGFHMHPVEPETDTAYATPDAEIVKTESGVYTARLLEHAMPHVSLSAAYLDTPSEGGRFVNEGVYYANRLLYCLERRNAALLSVLQYAAQRQSAFWEGGSLARLTMSEAADALHINRSTVSRAVAGKYVLFNNRVCKAASLFSRAGKDALSQEEACRLIGEIARERMGKPTSDREIAELLLERYGVCLSRRTVNKYRSMLGLPSSAERGRI